MPAGSAEEEEHDVDGQPGDSGELRQGKRDGLDEEVEEIEVDITEENLVWLHGTDWEVVLTPIEARQLGQALLDAAADAESAAE